MPSLPKGEGRSTIMEVTQINLNHCDTAQQLLWQSTTESKCDVAIIAEPYHIPADNDNWVADRAAMAAIQVMGEFPIDEVVSNSCEGFVIVKINGIFVCSCYAPPRWTMEQFHHMLDALTDKLIGRKPIVIGGDFNAWAVEWGSRCTNARGYSLMEALAKLEVGLANEGTTSTFRKDGRESIIDITFASPSLMSDMNWRVCEAYTHSDHQAIRYSIGRRHPVVTRRSTNERKWKTTTFDKEVLVEALRADGERVIANVDDLMDILVRACDATMPRKTEPRNYRRPAYWWTEALSNLRASCLIARRRAQRARTASDREQRYAVFRMARAALKRGIKQSKRNCYKELCREADANPWGDAYRIVMARLKGPTTPKELCPEKLKTIVEGLFPTHDPTTWPAIPNGVEEGDNSDGLRVSNEELVAVVERLKVKKAPGPDGIPNVALKAAVQEFPDMFRTVMQKCLEDGSFPDRWKIQKLVLLPKPGKPPGHPSSYRPICLLDTVGKLLERLILNRLTTFTEGEHGLSNRQFGFRKGRSTVDAVRAVVERAEKSSKQKRRGDRFCAVVTIDVKNAFNSASWEAIAESLHRMQVPRYLCRILRSYFQNRILIYETSEGQKMVNVTAGVPQGSILGPTLWNGMYIGVLTLKLPRGVVEDHAE